MPTPTISSLGLTNALQTTLRTSQLQLRDAELEVATGRHADVGLELSYLVDKTLNFRQTRSTLSVMQVNNESLMSRLEATQSAITQVSDNAQRFLGSLLSAMQADDQRATIVMAAESEMGALTSLLSTSFDGAYLFSGVATQSPAMDDYLADPPGTSRTAVQTAFVTEFGFPATDPSVATITGAQMQTFLDGAFDTLFQDPSWATNFSSASDDLLKNRISPNEVIETSASANEQAFRSLTQAYAAVIDLGAKNLSGEAFQVLADKVIELTTNGNSGVAAIGGRLGLAEQRVSSAQDRLSIQTNVIEESIVELEGVDAYEAATRMNNLLTQIEVSYATTARIQGLTILNYL
ncbi:MAG: flagellar hook-associated family protein [Pseudomonadota bacterium]